MDKLWKEILWSQFGATIDMLGEAMQACPDEFWTTPMWKDPVMGDKFSEFWYTAYHTLFWLDLYLSGSVESFSPPAPFDLNELDSQGLLPDQVFSKVELQTYLAHCRGKCREIIEQLTDDKAHQLSFFTWRKDGLSFTELLLDNMRHVQEHVAQLNMFLGQRTAISTRWLNRPNQ